MVAISNYGWDPPSLQAQFEKDCTERGVLERQTEIFNFQNVYSRGYVPQAISHSVTNMHFQDIFDAHVLKYAVFDIVLFNLWKADSLCQMCRVVWSFQRTRTYLKLF